MSAISFRQIQINPWFSQRSFLTLSACRRLLAPSLAALVLTTAAHSQALPSFAWHADGWFRQFLFPGSFSQTSFSRDGSRYIMWKGLQFAVYDVKTGNLLSFTTNENPITSACLSNDGKKVYYALNLSGAITVFDVATQTQTNLRTTGIVNTGTVINTMCVSEDGSKLAFADCHGTTTYPTGALYVYDLAKQTLVSKFGIKVPGSGGFDFPRALSFIAGGTQLVTDGPTVVTTAGKLIAAKPNTMCSVSVSPDEKSLYWTYFDQVNNQGVIMAFKSDTLVTLWTTRVPFSPSIVTPSADGKAVYVGYSTPGHWRVQGYSSSTGKALAKVFDLPVTYENNSSPLIVASPATNQAIVGPSYDIAGANVVTLDSSTGAGTPGSSLYIGSAQTPVYPITDQGVSAFVSDDSNGAFGSSGSTNSVARTAATGVPRREFKPFHCFVSPDCKYYTYGILSLTSYLAFYSAQNGTHLANLSPISGYGFASFGWGNQTGQYFVVESNSAGNRFTVQIGNFTGTQFVVKSTVLGVSSTNKTVVTGTLSLDGTRLALFNLDGKSTIQVFDTSTGKLTGTIARDTNSWGIQRFTPTTSKTLGTTLLGVFDHGHGSSYFNEYRIIDISKTPKTVATVKYSVTGFIDHNDGTVSADGTLIAMVDRVLMPQFDYRFVENVRIFKTDGTQIKLWTGLPGCSDPLLNFSSDKAILTYQSLSALFALTVPTSPFARLNRQNMGLFTTHGFATNR